MINSPNSNNKNKNGIMEAYDDRPISMYDNLNNMTANTNAATTTITTNNTRMTNAAIALNPNTVQTIKTTTTATPPTSSKANGAAHSTPFTDINCKLNENSKPQQKQQQHEANDNRNLNEIHPKTGNTAAFATPHKTSALQTAAITASPPSATQQQQQHQHQQPHSPLTATTTLTEANTLPSSPSSLHSNATTTATATANFETFNSFNRPLSQHSESELNDTSHSIAAVKAALNEAKSKFFGLNGCTLSQQQQQQQQQEQEQEQHYDDTNIIGESLKRQLIPTDIQIQIQQQLQQQQQQQLVQKSQPKYQNIPENSAIFRKQMADGACSPPDLPPKPIQYQNPQQPTNHRIVRTSTPDQIRQMPAASNTYNQISSNDIDGATSRSQTVYMATTVPQNMKGNKIAGRHTPTRSSLRHSRMLVVNNKNYQEVQRPNPMGFQQPTLARWLLILQIIIGILLLSISVWTFFLTPNIPVQDNPYWCGLVLLFTGVVGLIVVRYPSFKRTKIRKHCFMFLRMDSYVLSLLSVLLCCVALIFAAIHYCRLTAADTKCQSMHLLVEHGSCVCTFNAPPTVLNATEPQLNESLVDEDDVTHQTPDNSYKVEYRDLSCQEVTGPWTSILGLSFILNSLGFLVSLVYIVLLAYCRRPAKRFYNTVRTSTF